MTKPSINFIGAGKLGKTLAKLAVIHNAASIKGICNTTLSNAQNAVDFISHGKAFKKIADLPAADITFITTPDNEIKGCCSELSYLTPDSIVVHCSGALPAEILKTGNHLCCSIHPMQSFVTPNKSVEQFAGTYCALEGDSKACEISEALFKAIGAITYHIDSEKKSYYHLAGVFASNYLVTLAELAAKMLLEAGVEEKLRLPIVTNLMQSTLDNLTHSASTAEALTGPIARGDFETVAKHLKAIDCPEVLALYKKLGKATLQLTSEKDNKHDKLLNLLV